MPRPPEIVLALLVALGLAGCTQWVDDSGEGGGAMHPSAGDAQPRSAHEDRELAGYVSYMDMLAEIDDEGWDRVFTHVSKVTASSPTPENQLRLALVLSRADRSAGDLRTARELLADLLEGDEDSPPAVRKVARVKLVEIERRISLYQTTFSLRSQLAKAKSEVLSEKRERTRVELERARVEEEIHRIQSALADALAKLEAVTNIERSVERSQREEPVP